MMIGTTFKNHMLEVGLRQNWGPWHSEISQPLIYYILLGVKSMHEYKFNEIAFG